MVLVPKKMDWCTRCSGVYEVMATNPPKSLTLNILKLPSIVNFVSERRPNEGIEEGVFLALSFLGGNFFAAFVTTYFKIPFRYVRF